MHLTPELLAIGHVTNDISEGHAAIGGASSYAAITASRLGLAAAIVTSAQSDVADKLSIDYHLVPSVSTTTFRNVYQDGKRTQTVETVARRISVKDVPAEWRTTPIVLLAPVADEIDHDVARIFPGSLVVVLLQGWLRRWNDKGVISPCQWNGLEVLPYVDAAVVSTEDAVNCREIEIWAQAVPSLIVTHGENGASLHTRNRWYEVPAFDTKEIDPTGAGDVFGTAYAARFFETGDELKSAQFASAAASISVRGKGLTAIPAREKIDRLLGQSG